MQIDLQARGFALTEALTDAVHREARELIAVSGDRRVSLRVRLYDVNGPKGGVDKVCRVAMRIGRLRRTFVASSLDTDLYRAIRAAFEKLCHSRLGATHRTRARKRRGRGFSSEAYAV